MAPKQPITEPQLIGRKPNWVGALCRRRKGRIPTGLLESLCPVRYSFTAVAGSSIGALNGALVCQETGKLRADCGLSSLANLVGVWTIRSLGNCWSARQATWGCS